MVASGFSCCGAPALGRKGFSCCGSQTLEHRLDSYSAKAQLFCGMWDPPGSGIKPVSLALAGAFVTTESPGKPRKLTYSHSHSFGRQFLLASLSGQIASLFHHGEPLALAFSLFHSTPIKAALKIPTEHLAKFGLYRPHVFYMYCCHGSYQVHAFWKTACNQKYCMPMRLSFVYNLSSNTSPCSWTIRLHINVLGVPLRRGYMYIRSPNCTQFNSIEVIWDQFPLSLYWFHLYSL